MIIIPLPFIIRHGSFICFDLNLYQIWITIWEHIIACLSCCFNVLGSPAITGNLNNAPQQSVKGTHKNGKILIRLLFCIIAVGFIVGAGFYAYKCYKALNIQKQTIINEYDLKVKNCKTTLNLISEKDIAIENHIELLRQSANILREISSSEGSLFLEKKTESQALRTAFNRKADTLYNYCRSIGSINAPDQDILHKAGQQKMDEIVKIKRSINYE